MNNILTIINEEIKKLNEVRYIYHDDTFNDVPLRDNETIMVYHGFKVFADAVATAKYGLTGKDDVSRVYSYENDNNPKGLFVTTDFNTAKEFTQQVIMEFATKVSNLEAPVWVDGRSYFVQGEYTKGFKNDNEREQQRLLNRERDKNHPHWASIRNSDRPELAQTIYQNNERQALFIGDLNPNMIRGFWVNEGSSYKGNWIKMSRVEFLKKFIIKYSHIDRYQNSDGGNKYSNKIFKPNDNFNMDIVRKYVNNQGWNFDDFEKYYLNHKREITRFLWPKQIQQYNEL